MISELTDRSTLSHRSKQIRADIKCALFLFGGCAVMSVPWLAMYLGTVHNPIVYQHQGIAMLVSIVCFFLGVGLACYAPEVKA